MKDIGGGKNTSGIEGRHRGLRILGMIAVCSLMAVSLFGACRSLCETHTPALLWTLFCVLSPPLPSHSYLFFTEIPAALIMTVCWLALSTPLRVGRLRAALLGAAVGFPLPLHVRNMGLVVALTALFSARLGRGELPMTRVLWFLAPVSGFVATGTVVTFLFWGTPVTSPHASPSAVGAAGPMLVELVTRVFGLLMHQERGLLAYAPVYLLMLPSILLAQ